MFSDGFDISTPYAPVALYFQDSDSVEYVRRDIPCLYKRIDGLLTVVLDLNDKSLIGFRLKGFRNFYLNSLRKNQELLRNDFLLAVSVLEKALENCCNEIFNDETQKAYKDVWLLAKQDGVELRDLPDLANRKILTPRLHS